MDIWQEASQEEGWLLGLADNLKDVQCNKKKATQDLDTSILDSRQEMLANVVFIVCWGWMIRLRKKIIITIYAQQILRSQDAKVVLWNCMEANNEVYMYTYFGIVEYFL